MGWWVLAWIGATRVPQIIRRSMPHRPFLQNELEIAYAKRLTITVVC